jgi:uncharacterized membrane protein YoaK (UPF0700 family)
VLAVVGGFLDAYTYVSRNGVFATSQTGNVVLFGVMAARSQWSQALVRIPSIVAFIVGIFVAETLQRPRVAKLVRWPVTSAIILEILVVLVVGALPLTTPDMFVTIAISFVSSVQVHTFRTLIRWPFTTTITTGNLRTASQAAYLAIVDRDPEAAEKARAFAIVIVAFLAGAVAGALVTLHIGAPAAWCAGGLLVIALAVFMLDDRKCSLQ